MKHQSKTRSQTAKDWGKILLPALLFMVGQILLQQVLSILFSTLWSEYTSAFPGVPGAVSSCLLTPVILFGYFKIKPAKKKCSFTAESSFLDTVDDFCFLHCAGKRFCTNTNDTHRAGRTHGFCDRTPCCCDCRADQ